MNKEIEKIKKKIIPTLKKNKVVRAGIFGSYARGENRKNSDVDILVEINDKGFNILDMAKLKILLEKTLNKKIDLVEYSMIHPLIKKTALSEEIRIL